MFFPFVAFPQRGNFNEYKSFDEDSISLDKDDVALVSISEVNKKVSTIEDKWYHDGWLSEIHKYNHGKKIELVYLQRDSLNRLKRILSINLRKKKNSYTQDYIYQNGKLVKSIRRNMIDSNIVQIYTYHYVNSKEGFRVNEKYSNARKLESFSYEINYWKGREVISNMHVGDSRTSIKMKENQDDLVINIETVIDESVVNLNFINIPKDFPIHYQSFKYNNRGIYNYEYVSKGDEFYVEVYKKNKKRLIKRYEIVINFFKKRDLND